MWGITAMAVVNKLPGMVIIVILSGAAGHIFADMPYIHRLENHFIDLYQEFLKDNEDRGGMDEG